jgi:nucleoside recognition membrane protein YjiH
MKKLILGIGMLIGGILGVIGVMLTTVLNGDGFGGQELTDCIIWSGMMPYFIVFFLLAAVGLIIAYREAFDKN